jgi:hypothetical protein
LELELFISNNHNDKKDTLEENAMTPRLLFWTGLWMKLRTDSACPATPAVIPERTDLSSTMVGHYHSTETKFASFWDWTIFLIINSIGWLKRWPTCTHGPGRVHNLVTTGCSSNVYINLCCSHLNMWPSLDVHDAQLWFALLDINLFHFQKENNLVLHLIYVNLSKNGPESMSWCQIVILKHLSIAMSSHFATLTSAKYGV